MKRPSSLSSLQQSPSVMLHFLMNVLFDRISLFFVVVVVVLLLSRKPKINRNRKASYLQTCPNVSSFLSAKIVGERILSLRMGRKTPAAFDALKMAGTNASASISDANERKEVFVLIWSNPIQNTLLILVRTCSLIVEITLYLIGSSHLEISLMLTAFHPFYHGTNHIRYC